MTNAELLAKIKAEIERRLKVTEPYKNDDDSIVCARQELFWMRNFLSTLEPEKPMNLEEEISRYLREECSDDDEPGIHEIASHFAQWGAKHLADDSKTSPNDLEEAAEKYSKERAEGHILYDWVHAFIAGAKWQKEQDEKEQADLFTIVALDAAQRAKEQMMKEAVEGEVVKDWDNNLSVKSATISGFKFGDKVHVIVLPKEY